MESNRFDIEDAISGHINMIQNQGSLTSSDAKELRSHLLDSVESLQTQGLSAEESFIIARKRIGHIELLAEEYSKVNLSVIHNKFWSYLLIGFNLFYGIPSLVFTLIGTAYVFIYRELGTTDLANFIIITLHLLLIVLLYQILRAKHGIARFFEEQVKLHPLRLILLTSLPILTDRLISQGFKKLLPGRNLISPVHIFENPITELSLSIAIVAMIGFVVCLVFSLRNTDKLTIKNLFHSPSVPFLLALGLLTEFIAASTRIVHFENILFQSMTFGLVYFLLSFFITYYNSKLPATRYAIIASSIGFILEVGVGISADISRGNTHYTVYFGVALLAGIAAGRYLGWKAWQYSVKLT